MSEVIPAEAVEAAAKVLYFEDHLWDEPWETASDAGKYRTNALIALAAAAPYMMVHPAPKPRHQCEPWQIQVNTSGTFRYCAGCGEPQP